VTETFNAGQPAAAPRARWAELHEQVQAVVAGERSSTARFATAACMIKHAMGPRFSWVGFYVVDPESPRELVVGPYQGTLGCLRIAFGRGVCGTAAAEDRTLLVPDVHAFPGHIACDAASRSELVVPVHDPSGALAAVLDIDSTEPDAFDEVDRVGVEAICADLLRV
jgi:L-methionine (R)-S-oxide reductase